MLPKLACVLSREARHMSRLPFRPRRAGTRIKICETSSKTGQSWGKKTRDGAVRYELMCKEGEINCRFYD